MKVIDPNNINHTLTFIPRFYPNNVTVFELKNESDREKTEIDHTYSIESGILYVNFEYTFVNNDKFQIKVSQGSDIVYRGKLFITDKDTQDYQITE